MSTASRQFQYMKQAMRTQQQRKNQAQKIRTINTIKWKLLMFEALEKLSLSPQFDPHLIDDLRTIVNRVPEEKFVQAILNLQPFKPNFKTCYSLKSHNKAVSKAEQSEFSPNTDLYDEATTETSTLRKYQSSEISAAKVKKRKQQLIAMFIQDDLLSKEISCPTHPYTKIIQGYAYVLENRYKMLIDNHLLVNRHITVQKISERLAKDYCLMEQFFKFASAPIVDIFNASDQKEKQRYTEEVNNFMVNYLRNNERICLSIRKILRYHINNSEELKCFKAHSPIHAEVEKFGLPPKFQIGGCFVYTPTEIITFSELTTGKQCLSQLAIIREAIYRDIDEYYKEHQTHTESNRNEQLEVSSEVQLQILKFCLVKVQIFSGEILAQLKMLEILYGFEEMSYHFDQASYIHSQLTVAFGAIQYNL